MKRFNVIIAQSILTPEVLAVQLASKLQFWYSADHLTVVSDLVSGATDLTGNNRNGTQGTVGNRLTYFASDTMFGGRPSFGSTTNTGTRHLAAPASLLYRHQIFSCYYKDGIDGTFDTFNRISSGNGTNATPNLVGNSGGSSLAGTDAFAATVSIGGRANSAAVLPLPANVIVAPGNANTSLRIAGATVVVDRTWQGAFRHFVGASQVLTTQEIRLIEGVIAWNDGLQNTLASGHPYRNSPPTP